MAEVVVGTTQAAEKLAQLNAQIASGGTLYHPTLHLSQNAFVPGAPVDPSGITEANFDGYSAVASLAWDGAYVAEDGRVHATAVGELFTKTAGSITNTVQGAYVTDVSNASVLSAGNLPNGVALNNVGQGVYVVYDMIWGQ